VASPAAAIDAMRHALLAIALLSTLAAGAAGAEDTEKAPELSSRQCGLSTPYNVQVDGGGVWLYRHDGAPKEIFFHDGTLSVDHQVQVVSDADAQRLRRMEDDARALMPEVAGIARESIGITFDALAGVVRVMTGSERKGRKVERHRDHALEHIDDSLGKGRWDQDVFGEKFEANVEQVVGDIAGGIARSALWAAFTGRADRIEERADRIDAEMDRMVEARSAKLERQAESLCVQVAALREQQDALEYRYRGAPLVMLEPDAAPASVASTHVAGDDDGDSARTSAIRVTGH
jgi:hypothetical protein